MNRAAFFANLRAQGEPFGARITQGQVDGVEAILDACDRRGVTDPHHVANILAQVFHETGGRMLPVRETFAASDAEAIRRLDSAFARRQLPGVRAPYWRDGWFGRGAIQITHRGNYAKLGERLGVDLVGNPDLALDPAVSADIAVVGMVEGLFTGRRLADFAFPTDLGAPVASNPRRIVNGQDGTDATVARHHRAFRAALDHWRPAQPEPAPTGWAAFIAALARLFAREK